MADTKISDLAEATVLDGTELALLSQGSADVKAALSRLRDELDWVRPADWPAMPATAANTIHNFAAVHDHASNFVALRCSVSSGTWSVDWGDGTTTSGQASNTTAEHTYDFADGDLPAVTSRGYKVAIIAITTSGGNLTVFNPSISHSVATGIPAWLEMQINGPSLTTFTFTTNTLRMLERINFVAVGTVTTVAFTNMSRLQKLTFPVGFFSSVTSFNTMFDGCVLLRSIDLSSMGTGVTTLGWAFRDCRSLTEVTFPVGSLGASFTTMTATFQNCTALRKVTFPSGSLGSVTASWDAFNSCVSLMSIEFPSGAFAAVANTANMFSGALALQRITFPSGTFGSLTNASGMFNSCASLARIENCSIRISFSVASARLSAAALDEIYTALPTITSQTITVASNYGTSSDTPSIATGKGWTVTG